MKQKIATWKAPDWVKTLMLSIMTVCATGILTAAVNVFHRVADMEKSVATMAVSIQATERLFALEVSQLKVDVARAATKEGLNGVKARVEKLERKTFE